MAQDGLQKGCMPGLALARQAFLYGNGDGKPVTVTQRLADIAGCKPKTILRHIDKWQAERESLILASPETTLGLTLSAKELAAHRLDMEHLRSDISSIKWEMDNLDNVIESLSEVVRKIQVVDQDLAQLALKLLDGYVSASANKSSLRRQFLAAQKQWTDLSGVVDLKDVQVTSEKELAKGRAKMQLQRELGDVAPRNVSPASSAVFQRTQKG